MQTPTTIHIKTDVKTRDEAKQVAEQFGFTLSSLVTAMLKQVARTKQLHLDISDESPTPYMIEAMRLSDQDVGEGRVHSFDTPGAAIDFVNTLIDHDKE